MKFFSDRGGSIVKHGTVATAPSANAVLVDSGALPTSGDLWFLVHLSNDDTAAREFEIQHRNLANDGNVEVVRACVGAGSFAQLDCAFSLVVGERVRVITVDTFGAGTNAQASLYGDQG